MRLKDKIMGYFGYEKMKAAQQALKSDDRSTHPFTEFELALLEKSLGSTDIYSKILIANICIRLIADKVADLNYAVTLNKTTGDKEVVENNKIHNLLFNRPNQLESGFELMRNFVSQYITEGNVYGRVIGLPQSPLAIEPLFSRMIEPIAGDSKKTEPPIKDYEETTAMETNHYRPEEIIHIKTYNPNSRIKGISWLTAMAPEIENTEKINDYQKTNYEEGIFANLLLSRPAEMGPLTTEIIDRIKGKLIEEVIGARGRRFLILGGGLQAQNISFSPADLEVLQNEKFTGAQIATGLKVPAEKLGALIDKKSRASYDEADEAWIKDTILPLQSEFLTKYNHYFFPNGDMEFKVSHFMIPELQPDAAELEKMHHVSLNKRRQQQGFPLSDDPLMDLILVPAGLVPLKDLGEKEDKENL